MKGISRNINLLLLLGVLAILSSCSKEILPTDFGVFSTQDNGRAIMDGVIDSNTPIHWDNFIAAHPNINTIIMKDCPGSNDDEANLKVAKTIRQQRVAIHLPADAIIASGAVDLFLAGVTRTREAGSKIGVHAWADGNNKEATDFPKGHTEHQPYIDYYQEMGFSKENAEAFYYFTIHAAKAADIHWMTDEEIKQYKLLTE